jgi:hypothetical protein
MPSDQIEVYYHKSNFFRVVHSDGCYGGINPRGMINCGFYSERGAIPLRTTIQLTDGQPSSETVVESKQGLVRELEVDVTMDLNAAASFYNWLRVQMEVLRQQLKFQTSNGKRSLRLRNDTSSFERNSTSLDSTPYSWGHI